MASPPQTQITKRVGLGEITPSLRGIFQELRRRGLSDLQAKEFFANQLSAKCSQCGLLDSGRELSQIASREELGGNKKLTRLSRASCGQKDCGAASYDINYRENSTVSWTELWQAGEDAAQAIQEQQRQGDVERSLLDQPTRLRKAAIALVLCAIAAGLVYWRLRTPGWASRPSPYRIDPSTAQPGAY